MPSSEYLQQFAQQLASWSEQIIENGRTPFRRVDLFHPLQTKTGLCSPPLIFWINRQSMIAGGLIFLPDGTTDHSFQQEAAAAESLGLKHFVTWETEQINIWEVCDTKNILVSSLPLPQTDNPAIYHHRLYELIDQLKLLSVTGRIAAQNISAHYLLNLLVETLALSLPGLIEHCRLQHSKKEPTLPALDVAEDWNRLSLLRLLCLLNWQLIPVNLTAEHLTRELVSKLKMLPDPLGQCLHDRHPAPQEELPEETAVAFHLLLLRLQQLGWPSQKGQAEEVLRLLLQFWYNAGTKDSSSTDGERILFHSRELAPDCQSEISHFGAQLAANTLWRLLENLPHPAQHQGDAFQFRTPFRLRFLHANIFGTLRPETTLRRELSAHLRTSWPNRYLTIPGDKPLWVSEIAHTLGLTAPDSSIELHLPENWLKLIRGTTFCDILFENFTFEKVDRSKEQKHLLILHRVQSKALTYCLWPDGSERALELGHNSKQASTRLLSTLELPHSLFELFVEQQLIPLTTESAEFKQPEALLCYAKSSMAEYLWKHGSETPMPAQADQLCQNGANFGWLVPEATLLRELNRLTERQLQHLETERVDKLLIQLFGLPVKTTFDIIQTPRSSGSETRTVSRTLNEELLRQLEIDIIPHFPSTYLYRLKTGPLNHYHFAPPLTLRHEMLGQYELEDRNGLKFQVAGEETKEALMLASSLGMTSLELPSERQQTAAILDSYRQDLLSLQQKITELCHSRIEQPQAAQRLQKKLWQQLPLPPAKWLSG